MGIWDDGVVLDGKRAPWLGRCLWQRAKKMKPKEKFFKVGYLHARNILQLVMKEKGLKDPCLYRLRHGGASDDRASKFRSLADIKRRGRWATDAAMRRYEKATLLQKAEAELTGEQVARAKMAEKALAKFFGAVGHASQ